MGTWPSLMGWVPAGLCLWTRECMCDPKTCFECLLTHRSYASAPRMVEQQAAQQQMHTHASS